MKAELDYATAAPLTSLRDVSPHALAEIAADPIGVCEAVHSLVIHPLETGDLGLPPERFAANSLRPAAAIVAALLELDPEPLHVPRAPAGRVVGTCRHFAVLSCALLRHRAGCGTAAYFQLGLGLDHWIVEYYNDDDDRWMRVDAQVLGQSVLQHPEDLPPGEFLSGGEAWSAYRAGRIDAATFGVFGRELQAEIRGNAIRDLAALNKVETLPWDEWGRMTDSYRGATGGEYDELHRHRSGSMRDRRAGCSCRSLRARRAAGASRPELLTATSLAAGGPVRRSEQRKHDPGPGDR